MADKVLEEVTKVDRSSMQKVQTEEKNVLPDAEGTAVDYLFNAPILISAQKTTPIYLFYPN